MGAQPRWAALAHTGAPSARLVSRELLNAHKDNLGTTIKFVIFNELSNARNPNNMQTLYTVLQHSPELAPKVGLRRGGAGLTGTCCSRSLGWRAGPGLRAGRGAWCRPWCPC